MDKKETGYFGEEQVRKYLIDNGYEILKNNYCIKGGEIDIIACKKNIIAFVEVKTREKGSITDGFEAINKKKKLLIIKAAATFMNTSHYDLQPRFDAAQVITYGNRVLSIDYIEGAFDTTGMDINY